MLHLKLKKSANHVEPAVAGLRFHTHVWWGVRWRRSKRCFPDALMPSWFSCNLFSCSFYLHKLCLLFSGPSLDSFTADCSKMLCFKAHTKFWGTFKCFLESVRLRRGERRVWASALNKRDHMTMWDNIHRQIRPVFKRSQIEKFSDVGNILLTIGCKSVCNQTRAFRNPWKSQESPSAQKQRMCVTINYQKYI